MGSQSDVVADPSPLANSRQKLLLKNLSGKLNLSRTETTIFLNEVESSALPSTSWLVASVVEAKQVVSSRSGDFVPIEGEIVRDTEDLLFFTFFYKLVDVFAECDSI